MKDTVMGMDLIKRGITENKWDLIEYGSGMLDKRDKKLKILLDGIKLKSIDIVRVGLENVTGEKLTETVIEQTQPIQQKKPKFGTGINRFEYKQGIPTVDGYGVGNVPPDKEPENLPPKFYRPAVHIQPPKSHESIEIQG